MATAITRREFLYYLLGASGFVLATEACAAATWFSTPRSTEGVVKIDPHTLPTAGSDPVGNPAGRFWISNTSNGLLALLRTCVRDDFTLYKWVPTNHRFECPRCGSKYKADGAFIEGPAPRNLDRYVIYVKTPGTIRKISLDGDPVSIEDATEIWVDTNQKLLGKPRPDLQHLTP